MRKNPKYRHLTHRKPPRITRITEATKDPGVDSRKRTARGDRSRR